MRRAVISRYGSIATESKLPARRAVESSLNSQSVLFAQGLVFHTNAQFAFMISVSSRLIFVPGFQCWLWHQPCFALIGREALGVLTSLSARILLHPDC